LAYVSFRRDALLNLSNALLKVGIRVREGDAAGEYGIDESGDEDEGNVDNDSNSEAAQRDDEEFEEEDENGGGSEGRVGCGEQELYSEQIVEEYVLAEDTLGDGELLPASRSGSLPEYVPDTQFDPIDRFQRTVSEIQTSRCDDEDTRLPVDYNGPLLSGYTTRPESTSTAKFASMTSAEITSRKRDLPQQSEPRADQSSKKPAVDGCREIPTKLLRPVPIQASSLARAALPQSSCNPQPVASAKASTSVPSMPSSKGPAVRVDPVVAQTKRISPPSASPASVKAKSTAVPLPSPAAPLPPPKPKAAEVSPREENISKNKNSRFSPPGRQTLCNNITSTLKTVTDACAASSSMVASAEERRRMEQDRFTELQMQMERERNAREERAQKAESKRLKSEAKEKRRESRRWEEENRRRDEEYRRRDEEYRRREEENRKREDEYRRREDEKQRLAEQKWEAGEEERRVDRQTSRMINMLLVAQMKELTKNTASSKSLPNNEVAFPNSSQ
jgi:hypothetical protein